MPDVRIPQSQYAQPFADTMLIAASDGRPAISIVVKCYPAISVWYMTLHTAAGVLFIPAKMIATTDNLWAAHAATIALICGRILACNVNGEPRAGAPLYGQCAITVTAVSPYRVVASALS